MTLSRLRRHRSRDGRQPVFGGDFPDDGRDITEVLGRPADWDGTTIDWAGASGAGLPGDGVFRGADLAANSRQGRAMTARAEDDRAGRDTRPLARLRAQPSAPDTFPALPDPPAPAAAQPPAIPHDPRDTGPQQRLPRLSRVQERPRPQREPDCATFAWAESVSQFVMLCGQEHAGADGTWHPCGRRWADPIAAHMPFTFEALRLSAYITGWRLDAFRRWACPACQMTPAWHAPYAVTHPHPELRALRAAGRPVDRTTALAVLDGVRGRVVPMDDGSDRDAEAWFRGVAEHDLILDVTGAESTGRHRAGAR